MREKKQELLETFKKKLLDTGILLSKSEEFSYCHAHDMHFVRLENGARILTVQKRVADERYSSVNLTFLSGGFFDPKGREGAHHFMEHLFFSENHNKVMNKNLIEHNAWTYQNRIVVYNSGLYNTSYSHFGLLPGLKSTIQSLVLPKSLKDKRTFSYYKQVVLREISEHFGNYQALTYDTFYETILEEENPFVRTALGTKESVEKITQSDIESLLGKRIGTENLIVSVLCEGLGKEAESLNKRIEKLISTFPRRGIKTRIPLPLFSKIKDLPKEPVIYAKTPINNHLVTLFLVWFLDIEQYSLAELAFYFLFTHLRNTFFNKTREKGLSYSQDLFYYNFYPRKMMVSAYLVVPSGEENIMMKTLHATVEELLFDLHENPRSLQEQLEIERRRQKATPISQKSRLDFSLAMLIEFDHLADNDAYRKLNLEITFSDLQKILKTLMVTKPIPIIIGDLSR